MDLRGHGCFTVDAFKLSSFEIGTLNRLHKFVLLKSVLYKVLAAVN